MIVTLVLLFLYFVLSISCLDDLLSFFKVQYTFYLFLNTKFQANVCLDGFITPRLGI